MMPVADIERSRAWYESVPGLQVEHEIRLFGPQN